MTKLLSILKQINIANGHKYILELETVPKMRKRRNPFKDVTKWQKLSPRLQSYRSVKGKREGISPQKVHIQPLSWGRHISHFLIQHDETGQIYWQFKPEQVLETLYFVNGDIVNPTLMKRLQYFLIESYSDWKCVKIENIVKISIEGKHYRREAL